MSNWPTTSLENDGYVTLPLPACYIKEFHIPTFLSEQREFRQSDPTQLFVLGAFGALGNPSSYHHPNIRKFKFQIYGTVMAFFDIIYPKSYLTMLPDRFCIRRDGTTLTSESFHRDRSCNLINEDERVYGGWVNLDSTPQSFSCIPGSHKSDNINKAAEGFEKFDKDMQHILSNSKESVIIPPGHILIFNERMIHEVKATKYRATSYKLFMKWFISPNDRVIMPQMLEIIKEQGVPPLSMDEDKVVQQPPMYSKLHRVNHKRKLEDFSLGVLDQFLGEGDRIVCRNLPSLKSVGLEFPPYKKIELNMYTPKRLI